MQIKIELCQFVSQIISSLQNLYFKVQNIGEGNICILILGFHS